MQRNLLTVLNTDWSFSENKLLLRLLWVLGTTWKVSKYGVFSGPCFPVFGLNTGKYRPGKTPYVDTFHAVLVSKLVWEIVLNSSCLLTLPALGFFKNLYLRKFLSWNLHEILYIYFIDNMEQVLIEKLANVTFVIIWWRHHESHMLTFF